ncbi:MAG: hypothetical protein M3N98_09655 [Actinomycetota bacterium]|nr:hypothetical protein [Actinomycetota bacterium]
MLERVVQAVKGSRADWDDDAGEEWGRILIGNLVIAYIHAGLPLVLARSSHSSYLKDATDDVDPIVIVVSDLRQPELSASEEVLQDLAHRQLTNAIDPKKFSAMDLWFASV